MILFYFSRLIRIVFIYLNNHNGYLKLFNYTTWLIYYRSLTDDYETTLLLDDDEDDEDVKSTVNPTKPNTKKFNAGVVKRYIVIYFALAY